MSRCFLWLAVPVKDKIFMRRSIFSENFLNKTAECVKSPSADFCVPVGFTELCYDCFLYMSWEGRSAVHSLSSLVRVAIDTILVQFFLHSCNLFGWHCSSTSTGDKILSFTEPDLNQYNLKLFLPSTEAKARNQDNLVAWFGCVDLHLWWSVPTVFWAGVTFTDAFLVPHWNNIKVENNWDLLFYQFNVFKNRSCSLTEKNYNPLKI